MGPLREAVGFVNTDKGHWGQLSEAGRAPGPSSNQCLRRQQQHVHLACPSLWTARSGPLPRALPVAPRVLLWEAPHPLQGGVSLLPCHARVYTSRLQASGQARHLQTQEPVC